jgi:hypothetical protein
MFVWTYGIAWKYPHFPSSKQYLSGVSLFFQPSHKSSQWLKSEMYISILFGACNVLLLYVDVNCLPVNGCMKQLNISLIYSKSNQIAVNVGDELLCLVLTRNNTVQVLLRRNRNNDFDHPRVLLTSKQHQGSNYLICLSWEMHSLFYLNPFSRLLRTRRDKQWLQLLYPNHYRQSLSRNESINC